MLETVGEHALELLAGERAATEERHAMYFVDFASGLNERFFGSAQARVAEQFDAEHDNIRKALETLERLGRHDAELRLAAATWNYWWVRGHIGEGRRRLELALASASRSDHSVALAALGGAASLADRQHDYDTSKRYASEARDLAHDTGDKRREAGALSVLHSAAKARGAFGEAAKLLQQALRLYRSSDDSLGEARTLVNLGNVELLRGRFNEARRYSQDSLELYRRINHIAGLAAPMCNIALAALSEGNLAEATEHAQESLRIISQPGHLEYVANALDALAAIDAARRESELAARTFGAATALRAQADPRA